MLTLVPEDAQFHVTSVTDDVHSSLAELHYTTDIL